MIAVLLSVAFALISVGLGFMPDTLSAAWWKVVIGLGLLAYAIDAAVTKIAEARK